MVWPVSPSTRRLASLAAFATPTLIGAFVACSSFSENATPETDTDAGAEGAAADGALARDAVVDAAAGTSAYRALVMADAPIAYWRMGVKAGLFIPDETAGKNDLILQGTNAYTLGAPGAIPGDDDARSRTCSPTCRARTGTAPGTRST
jgi:hypothetical protein